MTNPTSGAPSLMPLENAIGQMLNQTSAKGGIEQVDTIHSLNRILAKDLSSQVTVPPTDNSAMDGYAFYVQDTLPAETKLAICGQSLAGKPYASAVSQRECVRITTGGILPQGTNTVMMQENVDLVDGNIVLKKAVSKGNSVRKAGEDIAIGQLVLKAGRKLSPADMALIASLGVPQVDVYERVTVAVIATGDELVEPGNPLEQGQIYESNRYALQGLLSEQQVDVLHLGTVNDDPDAIEHALIEASTKADLILSCGGVSVGDADFVKQVLAKIGEIDFWKVAIKPGKPFAFGKINNVIFCGLPGNPVSSFVTCQKLVLPVLHKLQGQTIKPALIHEATVAHTIYKRPGRADFQRGIAFLDEHGGLKVKTNGKQGSGIMTSVANANCYLLLEQDCGNLPEGAKVKVELF